MVNYEKNQNNLHCIVLVYIVQLTSIKTSGYLKIYLPISSDFSNLLYFGINSLNIVALKPFSLT